MASIAIIGPGAIGGTIAGWLGQLARHTLTICARTAFERLVVEAPDGQRLVATLPISTDPTAATPVDWVFAATKTYDTAGAAGWLRQLRGTTTNVAVIQNGVEHRERFAGIVPPERLLPVIVDIPAERLAPGHVRQHRHGAITAPAGDLGDGFASLFAGSALQPALTDDFTTAIWRKLALNSAGVVQALALRPASVVQEPKAAALMRAIARETIAVGRAVGARLDDTLADEVIARLEQSAPEAANSLLVDRRHSRPMEIDARNGVIVRLGARHGIATPLNAMAVTLLELSSPASPDSTRGADPMRGSSCPRPKQ